MLLHQFILVTLQEKGIKMPVNQKRLLELLKQQIIEVDERCEFYKEELFDTIVDVLTLEHQHRIQGTYIKQRISDKCSAIGSFLDKNRSETN